MKAYRPVFTRKVIVIDVVGNVVLPLLIASPLLIWAWIVLRSESSLIGHFVPFVPLFIATIYCFNFMARVQWKMWVRKERWTSYFQTRNTLAIKIPLQPIKFVKKRECLAFVPSDDRLILCDGTNYTLPGVPAGDDYNLSRGEEVIKSWWPEIDIARMRARRNRKLPDRGVIFVIIVAVVLMRSSLNAVLKYNGIFATSELTSLVTDAWLFPLVYALARWMLRRYYEFKIPLTHDQGAQ